MRGAHGKNLLRRRPDSLKGAALQQGLVQADKAGGLVDAAVDLGLVQPHVLGAEGDVFVAGLLKELIFRILEHQPRQEPEVPNLFPARPTGRGQQ